MPTVIPPGHHTLTPAFIVPDCGRAIDFLVAVFGGEVIERYGTPEGIVHHAEVRIGDSMLMMGDAPPGSEVRPATLGVFVEDCDATYARALAAGATSVEEPRDMFYGYRSARIVDPAGNKWAIQQVVELLSKEQIEARMAAAHQG